jgi:mannose-6-phosphate isomerase class I
LLGRAQARRHSHRFPLLVKLIDAAAALSVQVHPDDDYAAANSLTDPGKPEAWYILSAAPGAVIYHGFCRDLERAELARVLAENRAEEVLQRVEVWSGDVIFCPAGTVHAIGAGVMLLEVQTNADTTFRIYDWQREIATPRALHLKQALEAIKFAPACADKIAARLIYSHPFRRERLVKCDKFEMQRWQLTQPLARRRKAEAEVFYVVSGAGEIAGGGFSLGVRPGETFLLPACLRECELRPRQEMTLLRMTVPE